MTPPGQVRYPLVSVGNVYIFPGIPVLLQRAFLRLKDDIFKSDYKSTVKEVFVTDSEVQIAAYLNQLVDKHKENVVFGSYPTWTHNFYKCKITIESVDENLVDSIATEMKMNIPTIDFDKAPFENILQKVNKFSNQDTKMKTNIEASMDTIRKCFADFDFEEISVAFNGGKDNIAMLHLVFGYVQEHYPKSRIQALYIEESDTFPELEEFIEESKLRYNLELTKIPGPMKNALSKFLEMKPKIKVTILVQY